MGVEWTKAQDIVILERIVFSYYILERIGLKMGENGALTPFMAAWISHYVYALLASIMLYRSFRL